MENRICPIMSRPLVRPGSHLGSYTDTIVTIPCQKEKCQWWVRVNINRCEEDCAEEYESNCAYVIGAMK